MASCGFVVVSLSVLIICPAVRIDEDAVGSSKKIELRAKELTSGMTEFLDLAMTSKIAKKTDDLIAVEAQKVSFSARLVGDCYENCNKKTGWCDWCGKDKVCCRKNWNGGLFGIGYKEPLECKLAYDFVQDAHHECAPTTGHRACWDQNGKKGGWSDHCGKDSFGEPRACCRQGFTSNLFGADPAECERAISFTQKDHHECVDVGPPKNCWDHCDKKSGFCDACGHGRACCKKGKADDWFWPDAKECKKAKDKDFTQSSDHECVPVGDALDCFNDCGKKGGWCPQKCGEGKACCRNRFTGTLFTASDPDECKDAHGFTQDHHHECVPAFKKCADVCHTDKCLGTGYNPIPNGTRWTKVGSTGGGCCSLGLGQCDRCCQE